MNPVGTERLETARLVLRRFSEEDAPVMFRNWANDPQVTRYMRWTLNDSVEVTRSVLAEWVKGYDNPLYLHWGICLRDSGELIGSLGIVDIREQDGSGEIGYCLGRAWWGNGYTAEAVRAVLEYGLRKAGLNRVEAVHAQKNPASGRVMQKAGMRHEGTARQKYRSNDGFQDCELYGIIRDDLAD